MTNTCFNPWKFNNKDILKHLIEFPLLLPNFFGRKSLNEINNSNRINYNNARRIKLLKILIKHGMDFYLCTQCWTFATFAHPKACYSIGGESVGVDKPSLEASLEEKILTLEGFKEKKIDT